MHRPDMYPGLSIVMRIDMRVDMHMGMRMDMCIDICIDMCASRMHDLAEGSCKRLERKPMTDGP